MNATSRHRSSLIYIAFVLLVNYHYLIQIDIDFVSELQVPPIDEKQEHGNQRLVIFAGPHKGASTTVETFFFNVLKLEKRKIDEAFVNWSMPLLKRNLPWYTRRRDNPKQYTYALREFCNNTKLKAAVLQLIANEYESTPGKNVFLSAESFGKRGNIVGDSLIRDISSFNQVGRVDIVLNYRTTRVDHLLSNWKQDRDEKKAPRSFHEWLCTDEYTNKLDNKGLDIFGRAQIFLNEGWHVALVDLDGVEKDGLDVSHVIACEVLKVPCNSDGWIQGWSSNKKAQRKNRKNGDDKLTEQQYNGLETILRQRDCLYVTAFKEAERQGQMQFLHQNSLLKDCFSGDKYHVTSAATQKSLLSDEGILELLHGQVGGCK